MSDALVWFFGIVGVVVVAVLIMAMYAWNPLACYQGGPSIMSQSHVAFQPQ